MNSRRAVLIDIGHPAHVHVFRNVLRILELQGIGVYVTAREKEVSLRLLDSYGIPYQEVGEHRKGLFGKVSHSLGRILGIARAMKRNRVAAGMGVHNPYVAVAGAMVGVPTAILVDSEPVRYDRILTYPYADFVLTPRAFGRDLGRKQVRFDGYKELAYLHPTYFVPDPRTLERLGLGLGDRYFVLRFVAWGAEHDIGQRGFTLQQKRQLVERLSRYGRVFISSEEPLPRDLAPFQLPLPPERVHDALAAASLLVSESQTMTTEAAILGTPVVQTNTLVGSMSNFLELQDHYALIRAEKDPVRALSIAEEVARNPIAKRDALKNKDRLLADKIDVAEYLADCAVRLLDGRPLIEGTRASGHR